MDMLKLHQNAVDLAWDSNTSLSKAYLNVLTLHQAARWSEKQETKDLAIAKLDAIAELYSNKVLDKTPVVAQKKDMVKLIPVCDEKNYLSFVSDLSFSKEVNVNNCTYRTFPLINNSYLNILELSKVKMVNPVVNEAKITAFYVGIYGQVVKLTAVGDLTFKKYKNGIDSIKVLDFSNQIFKLENVSDFITRHGEKISAVLSGSAEFNTDTFCIRMDARIGSVIATGVDHDSLISNIGCVSVLGYDVDMTATGSVDHSC